MANYGHQWCSKTARTPPFWIYGAVARDLPVVVIDCRLQETSTSV